MNDMPSYLTSGKSKDPKIIAWWFRLSSPPEPALDAPLSQREQYRKARMASIVIFLLQIFALTSLPAGFSGTNPFLLILLIGGFVINLIAMFLNRAHMITAAGLLVVTSVEITISTNLITTPGGLSLAALPLLDLLAVPLVLAASLLPPAFVFLFALINSVFIVVSTLYLPHTPSFGESLNHSVFGLVSLPIFIQVILAIIAFIWVRGANLAIARADRAEQIALLERDIAESRQQIAEQKMQLDVSIQDVAQVLNRVANGDTAARISTQGNVLWLIAGPINNMLARMQRLRYTEAEHQQMIQELENLLYQLQLSRETNQPLRLSRGQGSVLLGPLYEELNRGTSMPMTAPKPSSPQNNPRSNPLPYPYPSNSFNNG